MSLDEVKWLRVLLRAAVRDGGDCLRIEYTIEGDYRTFLRVGGVRHEAVPFSTDGIQRFPAVLASWEPPAMWAWHRAMAWLRRRRSGVQRGRFRFAVGEMVVPVEYRVRWRNGRVQEIALMISADSGSRVNPAPRDE